MEFEATWNRTTRVWWSFLWRNLIAIAVSILIAGAVGFGIGFVMAFFGFDRETIGYVTSPVGAIIGIAITIVPIKLILNKNYGEFRLALIPISEDAEQ